MHQIFPPLMRAFRRLLFLLGIFLALELRGRERRALAGRLYVVHGHRLLRLDGVRVMFGFSVDHQDAFVKPLEKWGVDRYFSSFLVERDAMDIL